MFWGGGGITPNLPTLKVRTFGPQVIFPERCATAPLSSAEALRAFWEGKSPLSKMSAGAISCGGSEREPLPDTTPNMATIRGVITFTQGG